MSSEKVHEIISNMGNELNSYKIRKIFTPKEIQQILLNRKKYEMKLLRTKKNLVDFKNYIKYEVTLLKIRNKKMTKFGISKIEIDDKLEDNILRIYNKAFQYYNDDELLKQFADFCVKRNHLEEMNEVFGIKLLKEIKNEELWIYCSMKLWELEDIDSARMLLTKGLLINKSFKLNLAFFKLECLYAESLCKFNREMEIPLEEYGDIENGSIAFKIFEDLVKDLSEFEIKQFLQISKGLPKLKKRMENLLAQ